MREKTPQDYANELLRMYRENSQAMSEIAPPTIPAVAPPASIPQENIAEPRFEDGTGGMQINVTTLGRLYPVKDALVTVFTGQPGNMTVIETGTTDQSGKSGIFNLKTPPVADSQQANNTIPYSSYNVSVKSDGYVEQIAMNVPVFSGVVSVQGIDLLPITAAGKNTQPQIIEEGSKYNL